MQESDFENVNATDLFWTRLGANVVAGGVTYVNVTTRRIQWDAAGRVVGGGNGTDVVQPYGLPPEEPLAMAVNASAMDNTGAASMPPLSMDDPWIVSVQQVSPHQLQTPCVCVFLHPCLHPTRTLPPPTNRARTLCVLIFHVLQKSVEEQTESLVHSTEGVAIIM